MYTIFCREIWWIYSVQAEEKRLGDRSLAASSLKDAAFFLVPDVTGRVNVKPEVFFPVVGVVKVIYPPRCPEGVAVSGAEPVAAVVIQLVGEILFPLVFCLAVSECLLLFHVLALPSFFVVCILPSGADNSKSIQAIMYTIFCPQYCVLYSLPTGAKAKTDTSKRPGHPSPLPLPACLTRTQWSASRFR